VGTIDIGSFFSICTSWPVHSPPPLQPLSPPIPPCPIHHNSYNFPILVLSQLPVTLLLSPAVHRIRNTLKGDTHHIPISLLRHIQFSARSSRPRATQRIPLSSRSLKMQIVSSAFCSAAVRVAEKVDHSFRRCSPMPGSGMGGIGDKQVRKTIGNALDSSLFGYCADSRISVELGGWRQTGVQAGQETDRYR
jgi:hypothetical protein